MKVFPILNVLLPYLPPAYLSKMNPSMKGFLDFTTHIEKQVDGILRDPDSLNREDHDTVYHHLLTPQPHKGHSAPSRKSLVDEAASLTFAGVGISTQSEL